MSALSFLFSPVGRWLGVAVIAAALAGGIYLKGYSDGKDRVQAKWDAAVAAAIAASETAREDAKRDLAAEPDDRLRHDPYNRDGS